MPVDITAASFKRNPHPVYASFARRTGIVEVAAGRGRKVWLATRIILGRLLKDERFVKDRSKMSGGRLPGCRAPWPVTCSTSTIRTRPANGLVDKDLKSAVVEGAA